MHNSFLSIGIGLVLVIGVGGFVFWQKSASDARMVEAQVPGIASGTTEFDTPAQGDTMTENTGISATTVAEHNTRASCWSSINGNVYDLTSWIPRHPGGEQAILQLCGTDGSAKFNGQHGGGAQQLAVLVGFKIGVLAN